MTIQNAQINLQQTFLRWEIDDKRSKMTLQTLTDIEASGLNINHSDVRSLKV